MTEVRCTVNEGEDVVLNCAYDAYPLGNLKVSYGNTDILSLTNETVMIVNNSITIMDSRSVLHEGVYECTATNKVGNTIKMATLRYILSGELMPVRQ